MHSSPSAVITMSVPSRSHAPFTYVHVDVSSSPNENSVAAPSSPSVSVISNPRSATFRRMPSVSITVAVHVPTKSSKDA